MSSAVLVSRSEPMKPIARNSTSNPKFETRSVIDVSAGLIFRNGKLLITQRHPGAHLGGLWEFPGGKREPDETFEECLMRELREELDVEVSVGELVESLTHDYAEKSVRLNFFICRLRSGEPQPVECAATQWVTREQLAHYQFPEADARLLEKLRDEKFWRLK